LFRLPWRFPSEEARGSEAEVRASVPAWADVGTSSLLICG
jgi:hypothetical protein